MDFASAKSKDYLHKKLLIVEDEPDYATGLGIMFMACGYEIIMAYNGEEAVDKAKRELPDLILMDITMPRMNGFEACRLIRRGSATKDIPIVALSASGAPKDKQEASEAGIDAYIVKPFEHQCLMETVRKFISAKRDSAAMDAPIFKGGENSSAADSKRIATMKKKKILIVEDNPDIQESIEILLKHNDYDIDILADGSGVRGALNDGLPDLILMDVMTPEKSGIDVCREIKSDERTKDVPVILLSAKAQRAEVEMGLRAGAEQYITKPYSNEQLLKVIGAFLGSPASRSGRALGGTR